MLHPVGGMFVEAESSGNDICTDYARLYVDNLQEEYSQKQKAMDKIMHLNRPNKNICDTLQDECLQKQKAMDKIIHLNRPNKIICNSLQEENSQKPKRYGYICAL